ncbi:MAG TPA: hypothetical protein VIM41_07495 [Gammaproteobacteria bacterium]
MLGAEFSGIPFGLRYRSEWNDGYGAQGWKLDAALDDPAVIACTAYTGDKTPTSVLVHDILDHLVSGFSLSGYANEARATAMHGLRNGIEVRSSYEWMADEILNEAAKDDLLAEFLPSGMMAGVPASSSPDDRFASLIAHHGRACVRSTIVEGFFRTGLSGIPVALANWRRQRLEFDRMHAIGLCLQGLLAEAEDVIGKSSVKIATGQVLVGNSICEFVVDTAEPAKQARILKQVV